MKRQVIVIGLGRFGESVARSLTKIGHDVLAVDASEQKVQNISAEVTHAVHADATNEQALEELGASNFDIAIVAIGTDVQSSVLTTILLKTLGIPYVIARANNKLHGEILRKIGADKVVFPENEMGDRVAHEVRLGGVSSYLPITSGYGIARIEIPENLKGKNLAELGFGRGAKEGVSMLLTQRGNEIKVAPSLSENVQTGDVLVISGSDDRLESFLAKMSEK